VVITILTVSVALVAAEASKIKEYYASRKNKEKSKKM
jgi:hypothetical protein